ncbi:MAG: hypothetical protein ABW140_01240, partial [Candidatus Sedimenticola sp. 6PFRAG1]
MGNPDNNLLVSQSEQETDYIRSEQARIIYMQAPISNITVIVISTLFYFVLTSRVDDQVIGYWTAALYISALIRLTLWYLRTKRPEMAPAATWLNLYITACALVGISWSIIYPLIYQANDQVVTIALFMLVFGIIGSAVPILNISIRAFLVYTYPQALMLGFTLFLFEDELYRWLILALLIYLVMTTLFTRNANRNTLRAIQLQSENQSLIARLNQEIDQRETLIEKRTE